MQRTSVIQPTTTVNTLIQQDDDANDTAMFVVFRRMLFFTVLLVVAPLASFFLSKSYVFEGIYPMTDGKGYIYSVVVAVVVVHIILFAFLYVAFWGDHTAKKTPAEMLKETTGKKD